MGIAEDLLHVTDRFYDAAAGRDALPGVLGEIADLMGAECAVLEIHNRGSGKTVMAEHARLDLGAMSAYVDEFMRISPRVRYGMASDAAQIAHDAMIITEREMDRDAFYSDFLAPLGLRYFLSIGIDPDPGHFGILSLQYRPRQGSVDAPRVRLATALRPHLSRATRDLWRRRKLSDADWIMKELRRRFGLTDAEATLAFAILRSERLRDHAARRGIAMSTLYTHYDRLKHKAGCARQAELVALLQRLYPVQ